MVIASRSFSGEMLRGTYGYQGGEMDLLSRGLIFAGPYSAPHARVLLQILLMAGVSREAIAGTFDEAMIFRGHTVLGVG